MRDERCRADFTYVAEPTGFPLQQREEEQMQIQEIMQPHVVAAAPETSLAQARRLMRDDHIRHLPVVSHRHLVGLVTDRDLRQVLPSLATTLTKEEINEQLDAIPIETCMTRTLAVVAPQDEIRQGARRLLEGPFGCLPVVEADQLAGIVTTIDFLKGFLTRPVPVGDGMQVKDVMRTEPYTILPNDGAIVAYQQMQALHIRHLPVISEDRKVVGMLTDRDIRLAGTSTESHLAMHEWVEVLEKITVNAMMTSPVHTIRNDMAVADAGQLLIDHKFGCLPVVADDDILEGIITATDLLRVYVTQ